jgi:hypothetical protein
MRVRGRDQHPAAIEAAPLHRQAFRFIAHFPRQADIVADHQRESVRPIVQHYRAHLQRIVHVFRRSWTEATDDHGAEFRRDVTCRSPGAEHARFCCLDHPNARTRPDESRRYQADGRAPKLAAGRRERSEH